MPSCCRQGSARSARVRQSLAASGRQLERRQFHHVIDIVPTILEAAGVRQPKVVDGIPQKPIEGVSMLYTFAQRNNRASE